MVVVRILWVRHGDSLSHLLRSLGPAFANASYQVPDPGLTRQGRAKATDRGRQIFGFAPRIRAIFTAASLRSIQTAHYIRLGAAIPSSVGLFVTPYLGDTPTVPENQPLMLQHPMENFSDYLELPSAVDPLFFRPEKAVEVMGARFVIARERILETMINEGLLRNGETVVVVAHSTALLQGFGIFTDSLDVVEEWVHIDHTCSAQTIQLRLFPAPTSAAVAPAPKMQDAADVLPLASTYA